ncbi:MAG: penicillin-insensitive murein endopeptidase [Methylococcales bacterium]|nr:penicillin-insensitive murein endopeptidase [Methylococcales bacterium]
MFKFSLSFCLILLSINNCVATTHAPETTDFSNYENAQSIGTYTNGCLSGAVALPIDGTGYQVMRLSRHRIYGHPNLIQFIQSLGQTVAAEHASNLLIGDLGQLHGGRTPSGHRSHQNGLDVDIWFSLSTANALTDQERETLSATSMLASSDKIALKEWTSAHEHVLKTAAQLPDVERIFVNPVIKRELCNHSQPNNRAWLRKIRPWWKHDDHFHVRLSCPKDSTNCEHQESLPAGDGCDEDLAWWFSAEATNPVQGKKTVSTELPEIPKLCRQLLKN